MALPNQQKILMSKFVKVAQLKTMLPNQRSQVPVSKSAKHYTAGQSQSFPSLVRSRAMHRVSGQSNSYYLQTRNPQPVYFTQIPRFPFFIPNPTQNISSTPNFFQHQQSRSYGHSFTQNHVPGPKQRDCKRKYSSSTEELARSNESFIVERKWIQGNNYQASCSTKQGNTSINQNQESKVMEAACGSSRRGHEANDAQKSKAKPLLHEKLERDWQHFNLNLKPSRNLKPSENSFSVVSYNILAQKLLRNNSYLYEHCDRDVLQWEYRWKNLKKELEQINADVICLQEVESRDYQLDIKPWLIAQGYIHSYKKRSGNDPLKPDGLLTACRSDKFNIITSVPVEYYRGDHHLTKQHNVGLIMMLKMLNVPNVPNGSSYLCIGNTHLLYNPKRGDIKLVQLATFFAEINDVLMRHQAKIKTTPPVVLCGDFNSTPTSLLYDFVTNGSIDYNDIQSRQVSGQFTQSSPHAVPLPANLVPSSLHINNQCSFSTNTEPKDAPPNYKLSHNLGPLTSTHNDAKLGDATTIQDRGIVVDYIFYSKHSDQLDKNTKDLKSSSSHSTRYPEVKLKMNARLTSCTSDQIDKVNSLPNSVHSSDHLPVAAQFQICPQKN